MLLFDSREHLRNYFSRKQRFLGFGGGFGVFFLVVFSLFCDNESPFPEFPPGREAVRGSLTRVSQPCLLARSLMLLPALSTVPTAALALCFLLWPSEHHPEVTNTLSLFD